MNIALVDSNGKTHDQHLLMINEGTAQGAFALTKSLASGTYFVKAFTASMNDFIEDESYLQAIHITNPSQAPTANDLEISYDIQLLPEGGHIVAAIENTCGIKIINSNGMGVAMNNIALIDDQKNVIINNIQTNNQGMGKFNFIPKQNKKYSISVAQNSVVLLKNLPEVEPKGIVLSTSQNFNSGILYIKLTANTPALPSLIGKDFTAMTHKDGLSRSYNVQFEAGYNSIVFQIPSSKLYTGVNTITIFDESGNAILERLVFNEREIPKPTSILSHISIKKDTFNFSLQNKINNKIGMSKISVSALPARSLANSNRGNIYASAYLLPFLKGHIENPAYYFNPTNKGKNYDLDLLLLNQGWSKYSWNHIRNFKKRIDYYHNDPGISIKGHLRTLDTSEVVSQVLLYSKDSKTLEVSPLKEDGTFYFEGLHMNIDNRFEFLAHNNLGNPIETNFFYTLRPNDRDRTNKFEITPHNPHAQTELEENPPLQIAGEQLDEVIVNAKQLKYNTYLKNYDGIKITATDKSRGNLATYLAKYNYRRFFDEILLDYVFGKVVNLNAYGATAIFEPRIFVDGIGYKAGSIVDRLSMQDIDEIYVNKPPLTKTHTFIIFTNKQWTQTKRTSKEFIVEEKGLLPEKTYYQPLYAYQSQGFEYYGAIDWLPTVYSNKLGLIDFSIYNPTKLDFDLFIEGITEDGVPFSMRHHVDNLSEN